MPFDTGSSLIRDSECGHQVYFCCCLLERGLSPRPVDPEAAYCSEPSLGEKGLNWGNNISGSPLLHLEFAMTQP
jgi:hypothetical protein